MGTRHYACAISRASILEGQEIRVIIGSSCTGNVLLTGKQYAELQTSSGISIPAMISDCGEHIELNEDLMSEENFDVFSEIYFNDKGVYDICSLLDHIEESFDREKTRNKTYTIILEDVYKLLSKSLSIRGEDDHFSGFTKSTPVIKGLLNEVYETELYKSEQKEIAEIREGFIERFNAGELRAGSEEYDNFDDFLEDTSFMRNIFIPRSVLSFLEDRLDVRRSGYLEDIILRSRFLLDMILEDIAFHQGMDSQNIILTPLLLTQLYPNEGQVTFHKEIAEILSNQVLLQKLQDEGEE